MLYQSAIIFSRTAVILKAIFGKREKKLERRKKIGKKKKSDREENDYLFIVWYVRWKENKELVKLQFVILNILFFIKLRVK